MEENFNNHLGKKLRIRRLSLGLTQTKVAQAINVTAGQANIIFYQLTKQTSFSIKSWQIKATFIL